MFLAVPTNGQTWLICGGRDFADSAMFNGVMSDLLQLMGCPRGVIHGDARGADAMADEWALRMALEIAAVPADWKKHGRAAGPIRNQRMLDEHKPDLVIAFPGGAGTADMVARSRAAGVDVCEVRTANAAQGIAARSAETPSARPEGQEPDPTNGRDAPPSSDSSPVVRGAVTR